MMTLNFEHTSHLSLLFLLLTLIRKMFFPPVSYAVKNKASLVQQAFRIVILVLKFELSPI